MKTCLKCGIQNRDVARFCQGCAAPLVTELICPSCGMQNPVSARYCHNCAATLQAASTPLSAPAYPSAAIPQAAAGLTGMLPPNSMLAGRYLILKKLGQGGMGAVYLVSDSHLVGKQWALKEMSNSALTDPQERQRARDAFIQEARMLSTFNHPNLPHVSDYFSEGNREYLVMDYVEGQPLDDLLKNRSQPFNETQALEWADQLCDVLSYLHSRTPPVIFRDLKPGNIMLSPDNKTIKLIDFGIARNFKPGAGKDTTSLGTPGYAPPEQYGKGQTDARSDVYALGATLHHLLTLRDPGDEPFKFPSIHLMSRNVSETVDRAILKAVQQDVANRFTSMADFKRALHTPSKSPIVSPVLPSPAYAASNVAAPPVLRPGYEAIPPLPVGRVYNASNIAADLGQRFGAYLIDNLIIGTVSVIIYFIVVGLSGSSADEDGVIAAIVLCGLLAIGYFTICHARSGQTLGKKATKIKVVRKNGNPISFRRALWRAICYLVFPFIMYILGALVYLVPLFNKDHRALHDYLAGTWVVKA